MADAAWAELQAGESGARDKAWDRILKKNAVAKKAKKKRPPKRWEPPAPVVAEKKQETAAAGAARDRRGVAATVGAGRAADGRRGQQGSGRGPRHARQSINSKTPPDATVAELLHSCQPLLRRFEDPVEKLRRRPSR